MIKLLYFNDAHFLKKRPKNRIDEKFLYTQCDKLREIRDIAINKKVAYTINGGDLFNNWQPEESFLGIIGNLLLGFPTMPLSIAGNHDMFGYNLNSVYDSGVGVLGALKALEILREQLPLVNRDDQSIILKPIHFRKEPKLEDYVVDDKRKLKIIVSHDMITLKPMIFDSILAEDVAEETNADIILCSHFHSAFIKKIKNTTFINAGGIVRYKAKDANSDCKPQVVLITLSKNKLLKVEPIFLKSAKPYNKVFNIKSIEKSKKKKIELSEFVAQLNATRVKGVNIDLHIEKLGKKMEIKKEIIQEAKERIGKAKAVLGD